MSRSVERPQSEKKTEAVTSSALGVREPLVSVTVIVTVRLCQRSFLLCVLEKREEFSYVSATEEGAVSTVSVIIPTHSDPPQPQRVQSVSLRTWLFSTWTVVCVWISFCPSSAYIIVEMNITLVLCEPLRRARAMGRIV